MSRHSLHDIFFSNEGRNVNSSVDWITHLTLSDPRVAVKSYVIQVTILWSFIRHHNWISKMSVTLHKLVSNAWCNWEILPEKIMRHYFCNSILFLDVSEQCIISRVQLRRVHLWSSFSRNQISTSWKMLAVFEFFS